MNRPMRDLPGGALLETPRPLVPLWLLALFTFSGTLGMHIFVPALPSAGRDLGAGIGIMQWTVSLYIFGLAVGQLGYGPISDRFGRRPALMAGLALYTIAGLAAALAPDTHALIAARFFQAVGGCAGMVLGRAIVRDTAPPLGAARRLALMNLMVTLGPGAAPIVGGAMASTLGWRSIFFFLAALGFANALFAWRLLPETGPTGATVKASALARDYRRLIASPAFLGYAIGGGCATTSMYAFIACAPFIFGEQLHRSAQEIGIYIAILVSGVWLGSFLMSRLIVTIPMARLLIGANAMSGIAAFAFLGGGPDLAFERDADRRRDVRLYARRRHRIARRAHPGDQRQSARHRISVRPLRIRPDGRRRAVHRTWRDSGKTLRCRRRSCWLPRPSSARLRSGLRSTGGRRASPMTIPFRRRRRCDDEGPTQQQIEQIRYAWFDLAQYAPK